MYHPRLKGNHYEMGFHYGNLMYEKGIKINEAIRLSVEQKIFAKEVLPIYKKYLQELTDEVNGLADGSHVEFIDMFAWLVTMYGFGNLHGCSCFAFNDNGKTILARNSDMFPELKKTSESVLYMAQGKNVLLGNSTSFVQLEDGMNEYGLAVGMNFLLTKDYKLGINTGFLIRAILENCKDTNEAVDFIASVPLCSTQNVILADGKGNIAVVECSPNKMVVRNSNDYVISTNHFISNEMQDEHSNPEQNWYRSVDRYATIENAVKMKGKDLNFAIKLVSGECGFICQYDKKMNFDTLWSTIYSTKDLGVIRAEGNPSKTEFKEDTRLAWGIKKKPTQSDKIILIKPTQEYREQVMKFREEMLKLGNHFGGCSGLEDCVDYDEWLDFENRLKKKHKDGYVPTEVFLAVKESDKKLVGIISYLHPLTEFLYKYGGNVGYSVLPSERRKGYAKQMLQQVLKICKKFGEKSVLICCDKENIPSSKTIVVCGGKLENEIVDDISLTNSGVIQRYVIEI